jgi:hypothetical protein
MPSARPPYSNSSSPTNCPCSAPTTRDRRYRRQPRLLGKGGG